MDFFSSTPSSQPSAPLMGRALPLSRKPDAAQCGWYDSSFELRQGLDVIEQHDDDLYQLWQLAMPRGFKG